jgi:geranylgeranylglycerol-phosphate geranylgeranyltransferase
MTSALPGTLALALAVVMWTVSNLYNWRYKEAGLLGNMMIGLCLTRLFILGGVAVGQLDNPMVWTFGASVFVFDLGEEIAGGAMDMEGDRERSRGALHWYTGKLMLCAFQIYCSVYLW